MAGWVFSLTASASSLVAEGQDVTFTVTPSAASATAVTLYVQITGATVGAITAQAAADDFSAVFLPVTIPAGSTAPVVVSTTVVADTTTEGPEGFQAKLLDSNFNVVSGVAAITGTITEGTSSGKTYTLTTSIDNIPGATGDDSIVGVMNFSGAPGDFATSSTLNPGDQITGGAGVDTLTITVSGTDVGNSGYTATPAVSGVEKIHVNNVTTDIDQSVTFDLSLAGTDLTSIGNATSSSPGVTTKFTNVGSLAEVQLGGRGNVNVSYASALTTGTADAVTVNASNAGATGTPATFTTSGIETINLVSGIANNNVKLSVGSTLATLNVSGSKDAFVDANLATNTALKTVDASTATGAVSVDLSGAAVDTKVTLGAAGGTLYMGTRLSANDSLTGGSGTNDTLALTNDAGTAVTLNTAAKAVTGFERLEVTATGSGTSGINVDGVTGLSTVAMGNVTSMVYDFGTAAYNATTAGTASMGINGTTVTTASIATSANSTTIAAAFVTAINAIPSLGVTASNASGVLTLTTAANSGVSITAVPSFAQTLSAGAVTGVTSQIGYDNFFSGMAAGTTVELFGGKGGVESSTSLVRRDDVSALLKDASGTADSQSVVLKAGSGVTTSYTLDNLILTGAETVSVDAAGALASTNTYTLSAINNSSMKTLNISGNSKLTVDGIDSTVLTKIDGSAATGALTLNLDDTSVDIAVTGGSGNDTFVFGDKLNNKDTIDGGAGKDTLEANIAGLTTTTGALNISNVETLKLAAASSNATITATGAELITINGSNSGNTVTVNGLSEAAKIGLGDGAATAYTGTVTGALATATGTADSLSIVLNTTATQTGAIFKSTGVETLNIVSGTDSNGTALVLDDNTLNLASADATKVTVTATSFGTTKTVALGTLNKATTTVDASGLKNATFTVSVASATSGVSVTAGQSGNSITGSSVADTFTVAAFDVNDVINGGDGTDVLNASITADSTINAGSKVTNIETLNFTVGAGAKLEYTESEDLSAAAVKNITVTGGNTSSTFKSGDTGAAFIGADDTVWLGYDASTFGGKSDITISTSGLNSVESYKAGAATTDILRVSVAGATVGANNTISGFENVVVTTTNDSAVFNATGVTGATNLWVFGEEDVRVTNLATGVTVNMGAQSTQAPGSNTPFYGNAETSKLRIDLASASGTADALTINLNEQNSANATNAVTLQVDGVENLTLNATSAAEDFYVLVSNSATTDQTVTLTGGKSAQTVSIGENGINSYVKTINASALASNLVMIDGARSGTQAMSITAGEGNDTLIMKANADVLDAGTQGTGGADTLKIVAQYILGGLAVDLSSTTDQVTTTNGTANTAVQKGFEAVDLSGITGTFGAEITAASTGSKITGTSNADQINGGAGVDTLVASAGNDVVTGGAGNDIFQFTHTLIEANSGTTATFNGGDGTADVLEVTSATTGLVDADFRGITNVEILKFSAGVNAATIAATNFSAAGLKTVDMGGTSVALTLSGIGSASVPLNVTSYSLNTAAESFTFGGTAAASATAVATWTISNGVYTKTGATVADFYAAITGLTAGEVAAFVDSGNTYLFAEGAATTAGDDSYVVLTGVVATSVGTTAGAAVALIA